MCGRHLACVARAGLLHAHALRRVERHASASAVGGCKRPVFRRFCHSATNAGLHGPDAL